MAHMQPQITEKQRGWQIETLGGETYFVPGDVVPVPDWFATGAPIESGENDAAEIFNDFEERLHDYVASNRGMHEIEAVEMYFARLSAPGYLDCTEWCGFATKREAREYLRDL